MNFEVLSLQNTCTDMNSTNQNHNNTGYNTSVDLDRQWVEYHLKQLSPRQENYPRWSVVITRHMTYKEITLLSFLQGLYIHIKSQPLHGIIASAN